MKIPGSLLTVLQVAALGASIGAAGDAMAGEWTNPPACRLEQLEQPVPDPTPAPSTTPYDPHSCVACGMG